MSNFDARHAALQHVGNDNTPAQRMAAAQALVDDSGTVEGSLVDLEHLEVSLEAETGILWANFRHPERPCFSPELLLDIQAMQRRVRSIDAMAAGIRHVAFTSSSPAAWCLGGDLAHFAQTIRNGDRAGLTAYAHLCIDVLHNTYQGLGKSVTTIGVIQGDALGGGFESALASDMIIAERGVKFGLPEILFNLFPGMGAYSFLSRKLGSALAKRLIFSGELYSAEEMHDLGIVDILAEPGTARDVLRHYTKKHSRRLMTESALRAVDHRCQPVTLDELIEVTDIWVDRAMTLAPLDLRKMERLAATQRRLTDTQAAAC